MASWQLPCLVHTARIKEENRVICVIKCIMSVLLFFDSLAEFAAFSALVS